MPTYACNNACAWCYAKSRAYTSYDTPLYELKESVNLIASRGARDCILIGGEPTCYSQLPQLIEHITGCGLRALMVSNGRNLADIRLVRQLKEVGLSSCSVSIEGSASTHDSTVRHCGAYNATIQGIANCIDQGIPLNTITTIDQNNCGEIEIMINTLLALGVRRLTFNMCTPHINEYGLSGHEMIEMTQYASLATSIAEHYDCVRFHGLVPLCLYDIDRALPLIKAGRITYACSLWSDSISIDPHGNILVCNHMPNISLGNLRRDGVDAILAHKARVTKCFRSEAPSLKCVTCQLWNTCKGGCSMLWMKWQADEAIPGIDNSGHTLERC